MKKDGKFDIKKLAKGIGSSVDEIKLLLRLPFDQTCEAETSQEAKRKYYSCKDDSPMEMPALKRWSELFLADLRNAKSPREALKIFKDCPDEPVSKIEGLRIIAELFGVNPEKLCQEKMGATENLAEAISFGFRYMPLGSKTTGPKGKLVLERNNLPLNHECIAEISVSDVKETSGVIIFSAGWGRKAKNYHVNAQYLPKLEELMNEW